MGGEIYEEKDCMGGEIYEEKDFTGWIVSRPSWIFSL